MTPSFNFHVVKFENQNIPDILHPYPLFQSGNLHLG